MDNGRRNNYSLKCREQLKKLVCLSYPCFLFCFPELRGLLIASDGNRLDLPCNIYLGKKNNIINKFWRGRGVWEEKETQKLCFTPLHRPADGRLTQKSCAWVFFFAICPRLSFSARVR